METPKPMPGIWTLTAPDGRTWQAESPLRCCGAESRERIPAEVALGRILKAAEPTPDEQDAERYRWLRSQHWNTGLLAVVADPKAAIKLGYDCPSLDRLDEAIDAAIAAETAIRAA